MSSYDEMGSNGGQVLATDSQLIVVGVTGTIDSHLVYPTLYLSGFDREGGRSWQTYVGEIGLGYYGSYPGGLIRMEDGSLLVCGNISENLDTSSTVPHIVYGYLVKFSPQGNVIWHKRYRDTTVHERFHAIQELPDGSIVVAGYKGTGPTQQPTSNSVQYRDNSVLLVKLDSNGNRLWEKIYYTHSNYDMADILAEALVTAPDGGFIVGATRYYGGHDRSYFIFKVDSTGQTVAWELKLGSPNQDFPYLNIILTQSGDYAFVGSYTGRMAKSGSVYYPDEEVLYYGKFNGIGDTLWTRTFVDPTDSVGLIWGYDIEETDKEELIILGLKGDSTMKALLVKADPNGSVQWHRQYWTYDLYTVKNWPYSMDLMEDGGVVFTGFIQSGFYYPPVVDTVGQFMWLVRTDSLGCVEPGCDSSDYTGVQIIFPPWHNEANLRLHPNPATDWVTATFDKNVVADELRVYDLSGREVLAKELSAGTHQTTLSASGLPSGVYIVELRNQGKTISAEKLVIH